MIGTVDKILGVIDKGIEYLNWLAKTSDIRKAKAAIEAAEKYIQVNEKSGEFKNINDNEKNKLLRHYSRRFFHYN
jgi:hypothetical protein